MASSGARQALKLAAALLALAARPAAAQTAAAPEQQLFESIQQTIQETLARDGPYSPTLLGPLTALIELYQQADDDALAAVTIERARQVVRINDGLHTLEQVPYIEQLIRLERARGDHSAAWDLEQELLALVRRYPEDLRTVPVLRAVAGRHMELMARFRGGEKPPELYLGCYYRSGYNDGDCDSGSRTGAMQGMIADAQRNYSEAIAVLLRNQLYGSDELREMELELLRGVDLVRTMNEDDFYGIGPMASRNGFAPIAALARWDLPYLGSTASSADGNRKVGSRPPPIHDTYHRGWQSLARLYAYDAASSRPLLRQANDVVQMSDWELLHSHNGAAVDGYALVMAGLRSAGVPQTSIDELFLPDLPVVLPAFQPNPLARDETREATGHIDVAFVITKYGRARSLQILDVANASPRAQGRLARLIMTNRFRPRPSNGQFGSVTRVGIRYYLYP
jgi:hypothetical protein